MATTSQQNQQEKQGNRSENQQTQTSRVRRGILSDTDNKIKMFTNRAYTKNKLEPWLVWLVD